MKLIIGLPVFERDWILKFWFKAIESQDFPLSDIGFIFVVVKRDVETINCLFEWQALHPEVSVFDVIYDDEEIHRSHPEGSRIWDKRKYYTMVNLRNKLLQQVRSHKPERFFSLDSDVILEDPTTITQLYDLTKTRPAVSPLMYMTPTGTDFPDVMSWTAGPGSKALRFNPYPIGTLFKADIIMAAKMMRPEVYENVDYVFHAQGEDLGYSYQCALKNYDLFNASYIYAAHIMNRSHLESYLEYGDDRSVNGAVNHMSL